jgi:tetratricopeptide (TPR) repeat protein
VDRASLTAFRTTLFLNTNYDCLGITYPFVDLGVFSFSLGRIGTDDIAGRDPFNLPTENFSASETRFGFSYARHIFYGLHGGLTFKAVSHSIGGSSGSGAGADLGLQYNPSPIPWITVGASFIDLIQPRVKIISVEDKYSTVSRFGVMGDKNLTENFNVIAGFDIEKTAGRTAIFHAGVEAGFYERYFLRLGLDKSRPTFGAGLFFKSFNLDYAYENVEYLGASHRISLSFSFGSSVSEKRKSRRARLVREERESWENELSQQADSLLASADDFQNRGDYQDALGDYQKVLGLEPDLERARIMSDSMMSLIISEAIAGVGDRKRQELISGRIETALNDFNQGRFNQAISQYRLLLEIDPGNETISDLLASAEENRLAEISGRKESAVNLQNQGNLARALAEWGRVLLLDENDSDALSQIEDLKGRMQGNEFIANALSLMNAGRYSEALDILERADRLKPNDRTIRSLISEARAKSVPATTIEDIKSNPDHWSRYLSGLESYQESDYKTAIEIWTELEKNYPNNSDLKKNINQARERLAAEGETIQE